MITSFALGRKGQSSMQFDAAGARVTATKILVPENYVSGFRSKDKEGYTAIQLATNESKKTPRTVVGMLKKAGIEKELKTLKEIRIPDDAPMQDNEGKLTLTLNDKNYTVGMKLNVPDLFVMDQLIQVTGVSKGKGFQGVVKRHGFKGGKRTHGQSDRERAPGAIGQGTTPGRVYKGKRMAGRMGNETVTIKNLRVLEVGEDFITVAGLLPGAKGGLITILA